MNSITVLKFKLQDPPEELAAIAELCRRGANAGVENWLMRQRGFPRLPQQREGLSESTVIYHAIREAVPDLHSNTCSNLARDVASKLAAKVDWRKGTNQRRRDSVLAGDDRPPFSTALEIPVHNRHIEICFADKLRIELWGLIRERERLVLPLSTRRLPPRFLELLREFQAGERRMACSTILQKDSVWFWYLPVQFEHEPGDLDRVATLIPRLPPSLAGSRYFFDLHRPDRKPWGIGYGGYLVAQTSRLIGLRKQIGWRYRQRMGAGHGRAKVDAAVRKRRTQQANVTAEVRRRTIRDIVVQCQRAGCGALVYREPTNPAKEHCWFHANGIEWDWTRFGNDLKNAAARAGIAVTVKKLKVAEIRECQEESSPVSAAVG